MVTTFKKIKHQPCEVVFLCPKWESRCSNGYSTCLHVLIRCERLLFRCFYARHDFELLVLLVRNWQLQFQWKNIVKNFEEFDFMLEKYLVITFISLQVFDLMSIVGWLKITINSSMKLSKTRILARGLVLAFYYYI